MVTILVATLMAACNSTVVEMEDRPCRELEEIDSLVWKQPDSAFARLREFAASSKADSLDVFNGHYCQLLISELLYKNDYGQSNREELLKAVCYFDSLVMADGHGESEQDRNTFLDARAHYINGVGFYEKRNEAQACVEYLNALEVMEDCYEDQAMFGKRAVFMSYVYYRLLELFSAQFMMDPAITCGMQAMTYCQREPFLFKDIPIIHYHLGKQYDKKGEKEVANFYYGQAMKELQDLNRAEYRDVVATKALSDYQAGFEADSSLSAIRQVLVYSNSEKEKLTRFLSIGGIFTVEKLYDSALYYLIPVFEFQDNVPMQVQAAEYLLVNYETLGDKEHLTECMRFLANHKKTEGETKALVSKLEDLFKDYMNQKQKKEAEVERRESVRNTIRIVAPIAVVIVLAIIILAKLKSKKLLKEQQEEADRRFGETKEEIVRTRKRHEAELEAEREAYQKEREELERSLQQSKENVSALQEELGRKRTGAAEHYAAFLEEPVCTKINALVRDLHITTRKPYSHYHISLDNEMIAQLSEAVTAHYGELKPALQCHYPGIGHEDLLLCYLYLLGLSNKQIAVLRQRDYSTVRKQAKELMGKLRIDETVREYVLRVGGIEGAAVE